MRRWRSYYFLAVPAILLAAFFQYPRLNQSLSALFATAVRPALVLGSGLRDVLYTVRYHSGNFLNALGKQKVYLARIQDLEGQLARFRELERENERLRKLLNFSQPLAARTIGTRVIGEDVTPWKRVVLLDKGSRNNIKRDMAVVVPEGLAGRVVEAGPYTSYAILLPDPDFRVSAMTATSRAQGVVAGVGADKLQMKYLVLDAGVEVGEDVITSGVGSIFPKGLPIGKIEAIERDPDGLHLLAIVRPSVPFSKLEEVLCLISSPQK